MNYRLLSLAVAGCLALGAVSCSDDDNDGGAGGGLVPGTTANPTTVFPNGMPAQAGDYTITTDASGLVTKIVDGNETTTFAYGSISRATTYDAYMKVEWGGEDSYVEFYCTLNKQGYIDYALEYDTDENGNTDTEEWWFTYTADGRLKTMKRSEGDNEVTTLTYSGDDIVKVDMVNEPLDPADFAETHATIAYTDATHATPIDNVSGLMCYDDCFCIDMDEMEPAYYAGLLGRGTAHLPLSAVEDGDRYSYIWTLDADRMPEKLIVRNHSEYGDYDDDPIIFRWK